MLEIICKYKMYLKAHKIVSINHELDTTNRKKLHKFVMQIFVTLAFYQKNCFFFIEHITPISHH